jgi:hypothetical protein
VGMINRVKALSLLVILIVGSACSSSKWVVEDREAIDRNDFELLDSRKFLERTGETTPDNPIVSFDLRAANTFEYAQRVKTDRYIQRYRPSFKSILFGLAGAGLASSAALTVEQSNTSKHILLGTAGFITLASVLNMKAVGEPTPTGETRLLRRTGKIQETDIVRVSPGEEDTPTYSIYFENRTIIDNASIPYINSSYTINLIDDLNPDSFEYDSSDAIRLEVSFNGQTSMERIPLKNIFESFVVVSSEVTALRDEPELDSRNILTDLAQGSQLKLVTEDSLWYKVLYGISETWIAKSDANIIWRPSEFASQLSIIAIPNIPFGNVDVESNIPSLRQNNDSTYAFLLVNGEFQGELSERLYAERDSRLIDEYLQKALGVPSENIVKAYDIQTQNQLTTAYNRLANKIRLPKKRIFVYVSGYVTGGEDNSTLYLKATGGNEETPVNLNNLLKSIARLRADELIVFADLDNVDEGSENAELLNALGTQLLQVKSNSVVVFGSTENQRSRNFSDPNGDQKRHSIFTYFIADAIKSRQVTASGIINHLQRNVDYTSRRLHNQPQHVIYFGDSGISLVD